MKFKNNFILKLIDTIDLKSTGFVLFNLFSSNLKNIRLAYG